jgi:hypothetical protein
MIKIAPSSDTQIYLPNANAVGIKIKQNTVTSCLAMMNG